MKKVKLYLPFEIDFISNDMHSELIERYGAQGLGIYFLVLMELRNHPDYRCRLTTIKGAAGRCFVEPEILESVLRDFELFEFHQCGDRIMVSSPYVDRVMQPFEEKTRRLSRTANKKTVTVERAANGQFTVKHREIINKTKIETKTTTTNKKAATAAKVVDVDAAVADAAVVNEVKPKATTPQPGKSWEGYLEKAIADEQWMEVLAMNSGISKLFVKHRQLVIDTFRQHVVLQGNDASLHSVNEVKAYMANFMRQGTPTQKRMAQLLQQHDKQAEKSSPYRFETVDPVTGERSYFGNIIPQEAPPRPHNDAVWSQQIAQWI